MKTLEEKKEKIKKGFEYLRTLVEADMNALPFYKSEPNKYKVIEKFDSYTADIYIKKQKPKVLKCDECGKRAKYICDEEHYYCGKCQGTYGEGDECLFCQPSEFREI